MTTIYEKFSPEEKETFRNWLKDHLKAGKVSVTFKKKDETLRVMNCTLSSELAQDYEKKTDRRKEVNEEVCPVFDLDKNEWRSFRYDTITEVRLSLGTN